MSAASISRFLVSLHQNRSGVAVIEFALSLPLLLLAGLGGIELANFAMVNMRINQIAVSLADNASRAKQASINGAPRMREYDVNEALTASELQADGLDLPNKARMILSSLEVNSGGGQWIHWQRCKGAISASSSYGVQGAGSSGTSFPGMGPADRRVQADADSAIMFAEVVYDYEPLFFEGIGSARQIRKYAAMYVRDDRDLTQIYNPSPSSTVQSC